MSFTRNGKIKLHNDQNLFTHMKLESKDKDSDHVDLSAWFLHGPKAWSANVSPEFFKTNSIRTNTKVRQYVDMLVDALGCAGNDSIERKYVCEITNTSSDEAELIWKKKLTGNDMVYKLGTVKLNSEDIGTVVDRMLSFSINETGRLESTLATSEASNAQLLIECDVATTKFREAVDAKEELERDLFAKFVSVLNAKKAKIKQLQGNTAINNTAVTTSLAECNSTSTDAGKPKVKRVTKRQITSRPANKRREALKFADTDSETEDDLEPTPPKFKKTVAKITPDPEDEDLFPMDYEESPESVSLRARVRPPKNNFATIDKPSTSTSVATVIAKKPHQSPPSQIKSVSKTNDVDLDETFELLEDM